ncbi:MAG: hypothetical protein ABFC89_13805 [Methanospirillum sp.]
MERDRGEDGISEVVGFVIILAVVMAGLSLYMTYAVPVQGREGEINVMDGVRSWFVDYKTGVDQLWLNSPLVPNATGSSASAVAAADEERRALYSTSVGQVTLRSVLNTGVLQEKGFVRRYMPVLAPIPASAEVSIRTDDTLTITGWRGNSDPAPPVTVTYPAPALVYTSHNNYWLQQEYSYQLGGVFLRQWDLGGTEPERMTVVSAPPLSIYPPEGGTPYQTKVGLVVVNVEAPTSGFGAMSPIRVETNLSANPRALELDAKPPTTEYSNVTLTFQGASHESAMAWYRVFTGAAARNNLNPSYYKITPPADNGATTSIDIVGYLPDDQVVRDVQFEAVVANYSMRMANVPTMIE